jgi:hypothetical protein
MMVGLLVLLLGGCGCVWFVLDYYELLNRLMLQKNENEERNGFVRRRRITMSGKKVASLEREQNQTKDDDDEKRNGP